jgi:hypothetical protein
LHAAKLEFLGFNPPIRIATSKPKCSLFLGSDADLKVKRI